MPEQITLTSAVTHASDTAIKIDRVILDLTASTIVVQWTTDIGTNGTAVYNGTTTPTGATLLHNLNIGNFSTTSLMKTALQRLQTDGYVGAGSVTGSPS